VTYSLRELRNDETWSGLVCYRYLCETWKRDKPHTVNPVTDVARLKHKSDEILFRLERKRYYAEYVEPYRYRLSRQKYSNMKRRIDNYTYEKLTNIYKATMNPSLNPLHNK
jgi:hypothetical protein